MYREKIDTLQAAEERLLAQKTAAQNAAPPPARRTAAEALRQAEAQADTERQVMLAHTEEDCQALRKAALGRMDGAVAYLLEKVVKR